MHFYRCAADCQRLRALQRELIVLDADTLGTGRAKIIHELGVQFSPFGLLPKVNSWNLLAQQVVLN